MRIVVTGHTGFLGNHLIPVLRGNGHDTIGLSRSENNDVTNQGTFEGVGKFDVIIHLAAQSFVPLSFRNPEIFYRENLLGVLNCLESCRKNKAKMIYLSSYVYGQPKFLPITEEHPVQPTNPYMESKYLGEELCRSYHRDFKIPVCIVRPFNIYGIGQNENFLIPAIMKQLAGNEIRLQDSRPKRDYVHVSDVVDGIYKFLEFKSDFAIYNIGSGSSFSVAEIIEILRMGGFIGDRQISFSNQERVNEVMDVRADISRAWKDYGWQPKKELKTELVKIAEETLSSKLTL
jgi:nucleoside-diphosphate-sugar epimerase